ncbi:MAG: BON domain-containing protein [Planctomycetota bacterium]
MATELILHEATDRLGQSSHLFLRHVECRVEGDALCLDGKVPSFYLKQTAQSLLKSIDGVDRVVNRLRVVNPYGVSDEPAAVASI